MTLAENHEEKIRIVTTNFDRLFEQATKNKRRKINYFNAPTPPVHKNRWDGLVYLHGLLPESDEIKEGSLEHLVISSGDYGHAYLSKGWAADFVNQLFHNYTVCFIGYGLNDLVIQYMTDALAIDRSRGETAMEIFAFASYDKGRKDEKYEQWKIKNVTPILYQRDEKHSRLYETLCIWSKNYRSGSYNKKIFISLHAAGTPPSPVLPQENISVEQVLWAIIDDEAAKYFSEMNPVPPIEWLGHFSEKQFDWKDLKRFGIASNAEKDNKLKFSIMSRPAGNTLSTPMLIAQKMNQPSGWDSIMRHLAHWLTRHLNDPKLILWLVQQGGQLNYKFSYLVQERISYIDKLQKENNKQKLQEIQKNAPNAIPSPLMLTVWRLLLSGKFRPQIARLNFPYWHNDFHQYGLTYDLYIELCNLLTPYIKIGGLLNNQLHNLDNSKYIQDIFYCSVGLSSSDFLYSMLEIRKSNGDFKEIWMDIFPKLLPRFTELLDDALDLKYKLYGSDDWDPGALSKYPSISNFPQEDEAGKWTVLIDLTRDAWLATSLTNRERAKRTAEGWWDTPYPVFKRLAFFAAVTNDIIAPDQAVDWLLADECKWLWALETRKEVVQLLKILSKKLNEELFEKIEGSIMEGPIHKKFREERGFDYEIYLRLGKMQKYGAPISSAAKSKLSKLENMHKFKLEDDDSDEIVISTTEISYEWIDNRIKDLTGSIRNLCNLSTDNEWPVNKWNEMLRNLNNQGDNKLIKESWHSLASVITNMPKNKMEEISHSLSRWLEKISKIFEGNEGIFFSLLHNILNLEYSDNQFDTWQDNLVYNAINHPVGHATQALLHWWYHQKPKNAGGLHEKVKSIFTELCNRREEQFRHGRLLLAVHTNNLFLTDEKWTKDHLLPSFSWQTSADEARAAWQGFSWRNQLLHPCLSIIKKDFLETTKHYKELSEYKGSFINILTLAAVDREDIFTSEEFREAISNLPEEGWRKSLWSLIQILDRTKEQREECWRNRILPYLRGIWPQERKIKTLEVSICMANLCVATGAAFPETVKELYDWLQQYDRPDNVLRSLNKTGLCEKFPVSALKFLDAIISNDLASWLLQELKPCLDDIERSEPSLAADRRFIRLKRIFSR